MATYRLTIEPDPEPDLSWLDQPKFADDRKSNHELAAFTLYRAEDCRHCGGSGVRTVRGERYGFACSACDHGTVWQVVGSLGGVDYLISEGGAPSDTWEFSEPLPVIFLPDESPYTRAVALELIAEAQTVPA